MYASDTCAKPKARDDFATVAKQLQQSLDPLFKVMVYQQYYYYIYMIKPIHRMSHHIKPGTLYHTRCQLVHVTLLDYGTIVQ